MKKIIFIIAFCLVFSIFPHTALADGEVLYLDNENVYSGMSKSYSNGYKPTISNGKAIIVLPLINVSSEAIIGNQIIASLDLGGTDDSPFDYANYQKNVQLADNATTNGNVSSYLVKFEIPLSSDRYMGTYAVEIDIQYSTATNANIVQPFTVYVTTDGKDASATAEPESEDSPRPQPKIIIDSYSINKSEVIAGEEFDVKVGLKNTEDYWHAKNVVVTYSGETLDIMPNETSNTIFIDEIEDEETYYVTLKLKVRLDAEPEPKKIILNIAYEDSARASYSVTENIIVEVKQPIRIEFDEVNIDSAVSAGDSMSVSLQVLNLGKSTLYNVMASLEMTGAIPEGISYLGNMESGTSKTAEIYAFFGTLDMGDNATDGDEKYGLSTGTIIVTYEDEFGEKYKEIVEVQTTIEKPVFDNIFSQDEEEEEEQPKMGSWWASIGILIGVVLIIIGISGYRKKRTQNRRESGRR